MGRVTHERAGFVQSLSDGLNFYILPEVFRTEVCAGFDAKWAAKELKALGHLESNSGTTTHRLRNVPGYRKGLRLYHVKSSIFETEDESGVEHRNTHLKRNNISEVLSSETDIADAPFVGNGENSSERARSGSTAPRSTVLPANAFGDGGLAGVPIVPNGFDVGSVDLGVVP
jgi:hypothetical protein